MHAYRHVKTKPATTPGEHLKETFMGAIIEEKPGREAKPKQYEAK